MSYKKHSSKKKKYQEQNKNKDPKALNEKEHGGEQNSASVQKGETINKQIANSEHRYATETLRYKQTKNIYRYKEIRRSRINYRLNCR